MHGTFPFQLVLILKIAALHKQFVKQFNGLFTITVVTMTTEPSPLSNKGNQLIVIAPPARALLFSTDSSN